MGIRQIPEKSRMGDFTTDTCREEGRRKAHRRIIVRRAYETVQGSKGDNSPQARIIIEYNPPRNGSTPSTIYGDTNTSNAERASLLQQSSSHTTSFSISAHSFYLVQKAMSSQQAIMRYQSRHIRAKTGVRSISPTRGHQRHYQDCFPLCLRLNQLITELQSINSLTYQVFFISAKNQI